MRVSPAKHNYAWLPRKCDYRTDTQTDRQSDTDEQMPDKVIPMCHYASQATQKLDVFVKHRFPWRQQSENMAKFLSPTFWPRPTPGACDVSGGWATFRWTYSPSLVTVSQPKLWLLHFLFKRDELRTNRQTGDPITRCPRRTLHAGGTFRPGA